MSAAGAEGNRQGHRWSQMRPVPFHASNLADATVLAMLHSIVGAMTSALMLRRAGFPTFAIRREE